MRLFFFLFLNIISSFVWSSPSLFRSSHCVLALVTKDFDVAFGASSEDLAAFKTTVSTLIQLSQALAKGKSVGERNQVEEGFIRFPIAERGSKNFNFELKSFALAKKNEELNGIELTAVRELLQSLNQASEALDGKTFTVDGLRGLKEKVHHLLVNLRVFPDLSSVEQFEDEVLGELPEKEVLKVSVKHAVELLIPLSQAFPLEIDADELPEVRKQLQELVHQLGINPTTRPEKIVHKAAMHSDPRVLTHRLLEISRNLPVDAAKNGQLMVVKGKKALQEIVDRALRLETFYRRSPVMGNKFSSPGWFVSRNLSEHLRRTGRMLQWGSVAPFLLSAMAGVTAIWEKPYSHLIDAIALAAVGVLAVSSPVLTNDIIPPILGRRVQMIEFPENFFKVLREVKLDLASELKSGSTEAPSYYFGFGDKDREKLDIFIFPKQEIIYLYRWY